MTDIAKASKMMPASFETRGKGAVQTMLIVKLLTESANNKSVVKYEDILECYLSAIFYGKTTVTRSEYNWGRKDEGPRWVLVVYDRDAYRKRAYKAQVLQWFKTNMGSAILKGKILAIPIIETED